MRHKKGWKANKSKQLILLSEFRRPSYVTHMCTYIFIMYVFTIFAWLFFIIVIIKQCQWVVTCRVIDMKVLMALVSTMRLMTGCAGWRIVMMMTEYINTMKYMNMTQWYSLGQWTLRRDRREKNKKKGEKEKDMDALYSHKANWINKNGFSKKTAWEVAQKVEDYISKRNFLIPQWTLTDKHIFFMLGIVDSCDVCCTSWREH